MTDTAELSDRRGELLAALARLLGPRPGRFEFAIRLALICALTTLVVQIYQTPDAALTAYIVFFLNKPDRVESLILNAVMTLLITLIIGLVILMAMLVIDSPFWRVVLMTLFSFGFLFIAFASKLRPLAGTITLIVGYALDLLGTLHIGEIATRALLYAWLFITIPAGVSVVVNLALAPAPRRLAERAIAERLRMAASMLREPNERTREAFTEGLREGMDEIQSWLKLAAAETTSPAQDIAALRQATLSTTAILAWVDVVSLDGVQPLPDSLRQQLAQTLEEMARILMRGGYPTGVTLDTDKEVAPLAARASELWADMRDILESFAEPPLAESPPGQSAAHTAKQSTHQPTGFFLPDAFANPEYVRYSLKTTGAAMLCYVLYSLLDWPGIHTCFITCYIVSLGTTAETTEKLSLRIAGCLIGAAAGIAAIVYVMPELTSIQSLLAVVFLGALASAWVAAGSPRIAYVGFQMAFAFFQCVIQGPSPAFDLVVARDRIIGILLGNLVVYVLFTRLWPVSVARGIDPAIAAALRKLSSLTTAPDSATRRSLAAQVQGAIGAIETNLDLARYEPLTIRPDGRWLRARHRAMHEISALQGPLLVSAAHRSNLTGVARRLDDLADRLSAPTAKPATAVTGESRPATSTHWADLIGVHLSRLDEALALDAPSDQESSNERTVSRAPS